MVDISAESYNLATRASSPSAKFLQQLIDAVDRIEIAPNLTITYPGYESIQVSPPYQQHLQQMSSGERDRYLTQKLQRYLYELFMDRLPESVERESDSADLAEPMVNRGDRWYETKFYHQLVKANHGKGYGNPGWLVVGQREGRWQVTKDGLNIFINPELHLLDSLIKIQIGQIISLKMPPNLIDRGVYIAIGDAGQCSDRHNRSQGDVWQLYFNVEGDTALILLDSFSQQLNHLAIPFEFKLAYCDRDYRYLDAAILEFMSQDWQRLQCVLSEIHLQNKTRFGLVTPFFCQTFKSGLGIARKPNQTIANINNNFRA